MKRFYQGVTIALALALLLFVVSRTEFAGAQDSTAARPSAAAQGGPPAGFVPRRGPTAP